MTPWIVFGAAILVPAILYAALIAYAGKYPLSDEDAILWS